MKDVEDKDKFQSIESQDEPKEKLVENNNNGNKEINALDIEKHDVNADIKGDDDLKDCNNEAPNTDEYEVGVNGYYQRIKVVEGNNDENKRTEDDHNHVNIEEEKTEDSSTHEYINVLHVFAFSLNSFEIMSQEIKKIKI